MSETRVGEERSRTFHWGDPVASAKASRALSGLEFLRAMGRGELSYPPVMATLNFDRHTPEIESGKAVFFMEPAEYHYNPIGTVHGGVLATLLDSAMGCAVHSTLPAGVGYTSLEIKVNFVRPVGLRTGLMRCEGTVLSAGRQIATAEGRLLDADGKLYAHATTTCLIIRPE